MSKIISYSRFRTRGDGVAYEVTFDDRSKWICDASFKEWQQTEPSIDELQKAFDANKPVDTAFIKA